MNIHQFFNDNKKTSPVNDEKFFNFLFNQLLTLGFLDKEKEFDELLLKLSEHSNVNFLRYFALSPNLYLEGSSHDNSINVELVNDDYSSFLEASIELLDDQYSSKIASLCGQHDLKEFLKYQPKTKCIKIIYKCLTSNKKETLQSLVEQNLTNEQAILETILIHKRSYFNDPHFLNLLNNKTLFHEVLEHLDYRPCHSLLGFENEEQLNYNSKYSVFSHHYEEANLQDLKKIIFSYDWSNYPLRNKLQTTLSKFFAREILHQEQSIIEFLSGSPEEQYPKQISLSVRKVLVPLLFELAEYGGLIHLEKSFPIQLPNKKIININLLQIINLTDEEKNRWEQIKLSQLSELLPQQSKNNLSISKI